MFYRNSSGQSTAAKECRIDEWLDRIHSNIIWGENNKLDDILKDIEKSVSNQNFILDSKVCKVLEQFHDVRYMNFLYVNLVHFLLSDKQNSLFQMPGVVDLIAYASIKDAVSSPKQSKNIKKYMDTP